MINQESELPAADAFTNTEQQMMAALVDDMSITISHMLKSHENCALDALRPTTFAFNMEEQERANTRPKTRGVAPSKMTTNTATSRNRSRKGTKSLQKQRKQTHEGTQLFGAGATHFYCGKSATPGVLSGSTWHTSALPLSSGKHINSQGVSTYSRLQTATGAGAGGPLSSAGQQSRHGDTSSKGGGRVKKVKPLLADVIQAKKNLLEEQSIFAKTLPNWREINYAANQNQQTMLKSEFKTTKRASALANGTTPDVLNLDDPNQMRMAALKVIKSHQKQQQQRQSQGVGAVRSRTVTPTQFHTFSTFDERDSTSNIRLNTETPVNQIQVGEQPKVNTSKMPNVQNTAPKKLEGELDLFMKTADGGFQTIRQSPRGKWTLNYDDSKVKQQAQENYFVDKRNSFKVNPLRNLHNLLDAENSGKPTGTFGGNIRRKKQSVQLSRRPDTSELVNIQILQTPNSAVKMKVNSRQRSRRANGSMMMQQTHRSSLMTKDTAYSVTQMKSANEKQASSLSPQRNPLEQSTLFIAPSKQESSVVVDVSQLQKAQISRSNSAENQQPKDTLRDPNLPEREGSQRNNRTKSTLAPDKESQNDSFSMTLAAYNRTAISALQTTVPYQEKSPGQELLINENQSQGRNGPHDSILSNSDQDAFVQQSRPMLPFSGEFESIFTAQHEPETSEVTTPNLPTFAPDADILAHFGQAVNTLNDGKENEQKRRKRLDFTVRHRSTLKGQAKVPFEFIFLKDEGKFEQQMRKQCAKSARVHKANMKSMIARLTKESVNESTITIEQIIKVEEACLRTKFELENALYQKFDVRKATRKGQKYDNSWHQRVDDFLEREKTLTGQHLYAHQFQIFDEDFSKEQENVAKTNKAGDVETQEALIQQIKSLEDSAKNMTAFMNPQVTESTIPIQILYNKKIEAIRVIEYEARTVPLPIKFDISDCYAGIETTKLVKIVSASAPKEYIFELDLARGKGPKIFETQLERLTRNRKFRQEAPLVITDYTRGAKDNTAVADFVEALHQRVMNQQTNLSFNRKLFSKKKTEEERHEKFTKKVLGMRRGKQFNFEKMERPEPEDRDSKAVGVEPSSPSKLKMPVAALSGSLESVLSEDSSVILEEVNDYVSLAHKRDSASTLEKRERGVSLSIPIKKERQAVAQKRSQSSFGSVTTSPKSSSKRLGSTKMRSSKQVSFKRQGLARRIASDIYEDSELGFEDMREREALLGLTVAKNFDSNYEQRRAEKVQKALDTAEVSVYEGRVPVHQRLALLCYDFLESTWDFDINELFNFQSNVHSFENSMNDTKAYKMKKLIKELFKKYQLEIVTPNIDYIVKKFKTAYEMYKADEAKNEKVGKEIIHKQKASELIKFNHSTYDQVKETNVITENKRKAKESKQQLFNGDFDPTQIELGPLPMSMNKHKSAMDNTAKRRNAIIPRLSTSSVLGKDFCQKTTTTKNTTKVSPGRSRRRSIFAKGSKTMVLRDFKAKQPIKTVPEGDDSLSVTTDSITPRTGVTAEQQKEDLKGRWFKKLDWEEDENMQKFGLRKGVNQIVTKPAPKPSSRSRSRNGMQATVLCTLAETSAKIFEDGFDQTALRRDIVRQKSMFSRNLKLKEILTNEEALYKRISGEDYKPDLL